MGENRSVIVRENREDQMRGGRMRGRLCDRKKDKELP